VWFALGRPLFRAVIALGEILLVIFGKIFHW
jgi:hypothetical protein